MDTAKKFAVLVCISVLVIVKANAQADQVVMSDGKNLFDAMSGRLLGELPRGSEWLLSYPELQNGLSYTTSFTDEQRRAFEISPNYSLSRAVQSESDANVWVVLESEKRLGPGWMLFTYNASSRTRRNLLQGDYRTGEAYRPITFLHSQKVLLERFQRLAEQEHSGLVTLDLVTGDTNALSFDQKYFGTPIIDNSRSQILFSLVSCDNGACQLMSDAFAILDLQSSITKEYRIQPGYKIAGWLSGSYKSVMPPPVYQMAGSKWPWVSGIYHTITRTVQDYSSHYACGSFVTTPTTYHSGFAMDFDLPSGESVRCAFPGHVIYAAFGTAGSGSGGFGNNVIVEHSDGYLSRYAHLNNIGVSVGDDLSLGCEIGKAGITGCSTNNHLHWEVMDSDGNRVQFTVGECSNNTPKPGYSVLSSNAPVSSALDYTLRCNQAVDLVCGVPYTSTTIGYASRVSAYGCNTWNESGPERVHRIYHSGGDINASLSNITAGADLDVFILSGCNATQCVGTSSGTTAQYIAAPAGEYYVVVDGSNGPTPSLYTCSTGTHNGSYGDYTLTVTANCSTTCDDHEPNNTSSTSEPLQAETDYNLCLHANDVGDWYAFYVNQGGELDITIDNISNPLLNFALYDPGESLIASDLSGTTTTKQFTKCWSGSNFCSFVYLRIWPDVVFTNSVRTYSVHSDWQPGASCFNLFLPPPYSASASPSTVCSGQNTTLTASPGGAVAYAWHAAANGAGATIGTTASLTVSPASTTTYSVVISPTCNTANNITFNLPITVMAAPNANAGADQTIAAGGGINLAGSGGSTYSWSPTSSLSNPNIWNPFATPSVTTTYTLTVMNASGCTDTDQVTITVSGGGGAPANDNPCNATPLTVTTSCNYVTGTNVNATSSSVATPSTCAGSSTSSNPSGNYQGGDVWYSAVVPSSGQLIIQTQIQSTVTDLVIVAYTGTSCSSLTQLACNDDQVPGSNYMPRLQLSGLTSGQTIRFRIYDFGNNNFGNFGVCVYNPGGGSGSVGKDLISSITYVEDNTVNQGDQIDVTYKVKNIGTVNVTTAFLSALYLSSDPTYSSGSDALLDGSIEVIVSLNAGVELTFTNTITIPNQPNGSYYLISYADAATAVGESSESNNFGYSPIQIGSLAPNGPNLEIDDVDVLPNSGVAPGQGVNVAVRLKNTGNAHAHDCHVLIVFDINQSGAYDPGTDIFLQDIYFPDLLAGEDDTRNRNLFLPVAIPSIGGYQVIAVADINNECNETDESDNQGGEEVQISTISPAGPDLVPTFQHIELPPPSDVQVSPAALCISNGYDVLYSVSNIGLLNAPGSAQIGMAVYISQDPLISGDDFVWGTTATGAGTFTHGHTQNYHRNDHFDGLSPGPWYLIVSADEDNVIQETNEANNVVAYPIYILDCGAALPDLAGAIDFYSPYASDLGDTISTQLRIWNQGNALASPFLLALYTSDDEQFDGSGGHGVSDVRLEGPGYLNVPNTLYPGDTLTIALSGITHDLFSTGQKYLYMSIDDNTAVNELDRSNNNVHVPIMINSIACYYNPEWLQLSSGNVGYEDWMGFPLLIHTEANCTWAFTENVDWAFGNYNGTGDGVDFLHVLANPYPVERTVTLLLNGSVPIDVVQAARPCALVGDSLLPSMTASLSNTTCGLANGQVVVSATGHYLPLQYNWSSAQSTNNITNLLPGSYTVTITDAAGCSVDSTFSITNTGSSNCTQVQIKVYLEGPYNGTNMNDDLRQLGVLPTAEPYGSLFGHVGSGGNETVPANRLTVTGDSAVVDWLYVQLRSASDNTIIVETRSALLLRNGAVVASAGGGPLVFQSGSGSYYISVRHRNHLGVMTAQPVTFNGSLVQIDFRNTATPTWGTEAQKSTGSTRVLWAGNTIADHTIRYTGMNNDRDPILLRIGGVTPTNTVTGYFLEDCNLSGIVKYTGISNDRDSILVNIGGVIPTNTRTEQLP